MNKFQIDVLIYVKNGVMRFDKNSPQLLIPRTINIGNIKKLPRTKLKKKKKKETNKLVIKEFSTPG